MYHLLDPANSKLGDWLRSADVPDYRERQIMTRLFQGRVANFSEMSDLPKQLRAQLSRDFQIWTSKTIRRSRSEDGTEKLLLQLHDGGQIECVLLRDGHRRTICISTQVGCAMGCVFCASGLDGVQRDLTAGEMLEQMLQLQRLLPRDERLSHIVVMGMGEPLANLGQLLPALDVATRKDRFGISARRITISTVGLPKAMDQLTRRRCRFHLAVSLHAPNDQLRGKLVPVNRGIGLNAILQAADRYFAESSRRLTFEYVLLAGINDQPAHAHQLVKLLRHRTALLNVIPYNAVAGLPFKTPSVSAVGLFRDVLEKGGLTVKFRQRKGDKIDAACGQLRRGTANTTEISLNQI